MKKYNSHVFICSSCRYAPDSSRPDELNPESQSQDLRKALKARAKEKLNELYPDKRIRISGSTCLGRCKEGIACVIYPQGEWLTHLRPENIEEQIFTAINKLMAD